eukprot:gene7109-213_t
MAEVKPAVPELSPKAQAAKDGATLEGAEPTTVKAALPELSHEAQAAGTAVGI